MVAAARKLGLVMRKLFGIGKPRCLQGGFSFVYLLQLVRTVLRTTLSPLNRLEQPRRLRHATSRPTVVAI
jgi:hypothetical protein